MMEYQHQHSAELSLDQMVLLCRVCGAVLISVPAQYRGICSTCVDHRPLVGPQPVSRPKLTAKHSYTSRKRRRYPPDWFYEASTDEVLQLVNLITNAMDSPPLTVSPSDEPRYVRELQVIYAHAAEQYFAVNTPFGSNRDGLLRWFAEQLRDHQQRFRP
jgi:hypothetical protein